MNMSSAAILSLIIYLSFNYLGSNPGAHTQKTCTLLQTTKLAQLCLLIQETLTISQPL